VEQVIGTVNPAQPAGMLALLTCGFGAPYRERNRPLNRHPQEVAVARALVESGSTITHLMATEASSTYFIHRGR
jgi:hypothetical protein